MKLYQPVHKLFGTRFCLFLSLSCESTNTIRDKEYTFPPDEALLTFEVKRAIRIEVIVSELMVSDPVDMEIDEYGLLYITKMHDHPSGRNNKARMIVPPDSDEGGKTEKKEVLLTGFFLSQPHVAANHPIRALEHPIYLSCFGSIGGRKFKKAFDDKGDETGFVNQTGSPGCPQNTNRMNPHFLLERQKPEMTAACSRFGQIFAPRHGHRIRELKKMTA